MYYKFVFDIFEDKLRVKRLFILSAVFVMKYKERPPYLQQFEYLWCSSFLKVRIGTTLGFQVPNNLCELGTSMTRQGY